MAPNSLGTRSGTRPPPAPNQRPEVPVAVLAGEYDPVTPLEEARAIAAAAPRSRLAIIPHGRHDDFHTLGREEMTAALTWVAHARN